MKKCCFVIPYFGKMPNYFPLFLKSCSYNLDFNWLIFTDDQTEYEYPENVERVLITFNDIKKTFQNKFDFEISLDAPYKLCDYRPAYGYVFSDYLFQYKYWGYCDVDLLVGKLNKFLTDEVLDAYDKFFCLGHLALIKNTDENNSLFMQEMLDGYWYKEVFTNKVNLIFDENCRSKKNINLIFLERGKKVLEADWSINFKIFPTKFVKIKFLPQSGTFEEDASPAVYLWENGEVTRYCMENKKIRREEFLYIHLQERKMLYDSSVLESSRVQVIPNRFVKFEHNMVTVENFNHIKKYSFNLHFLQYHYKWKKKRIRELIKLWK